jgi:hypothetical protein
MHEMEGYPMMSQAESVLVTPRRNFLIRALGFTAAGASMSIPIVTVANAEARIDHHTKELEKAYRDHFAGLKVEVMCNGVTAEEIWGIGERWAWRGGSRYTPDQIREGRTSCHTLMLQVSRPRDVGEIDFRDRSGTWNTFK